MTTKAKRERQRYERFLNCIRKSKGTWIDSIGREWEYGGLSELGGAELMKVPARSDNQYVTSFRVFYTLWECNGVRFNIHVEPCA